MSRVLSMFEQPQAGGHFEFQHDGMLRPRIEIQYVRIGLSFQFGCTLLADLPSGGRTGGRRDDAVSLHHHELRRRPNFNQPPSSSMSQWTAGSSIRVYFFESIQAEEANDKIMKVPTQHCEKKKNSTVFCLRKAKKHGKKEGRPERDDCITFHH